MEETLARLAELVAFDTQNPSGDENPLLEKLSYDLRALGGSDVRVGSVGRHGYVYSRFGVETPKLLINAHVDTVPANAGYTRPPHRLEVTNGRAYGLGTADTKGSIAVVLDAIAHAHSSGHRPSVAVLFSGDEERSSACMKAFLESDLSRGFERAVVCEPTGCRVGVRHRGVGTAVATLRSRGGHSSLADEIPNPIVELARAAVALDAMGQRYRGRGPHGFPGLCLSVGAIEGGVAFNVIPSEARLTVCLRPGPGAMSVKECLAEAEREVRNAVSPKAVEWAVVTENPSFATRDLEGFAATAGAPVDSPVDLSFWTEAALISQAGIDAVVFGPGRVEQAHAADEYVDIEDLRLARVHLLRLLSQ